MAQKIKNFWLKLGAMFLTLYFMPLADFVMGFLGLNGSGKAYAGTLKCGTNTHECDGVSGQTLKPVEDGGPVLQCRCKTNSNMVYDVGCYEVIVGDINWDGRIELVFNAGSCYSPNACSPNGATKDCSSESRYGTSTCKDSVWGSCVYGACKSGYVMVSNTCYASCSISNGSGYEKWVSESSSSTTGV